MCCRKAIVSLCVENSLQVEVEHEMHSQLCLLAPGVVVVMEIAKNCAGREQRCKCIFAVRRRRSQKVAADNFGQEACFFSAWTYK